jgi:heme exporter protein B
VSVLGAILWKDLVTEWRSRDRLVAMGVFAVLVIVILYLAAPPGRGPEANLHVPGLLWVAIAFAAVLGLNRSFALELENDAIAGLALAPVDRGFLFLGKALANWLLVLAMEVLTAFAAALAFGLDLAPVALPLAAVGALGAAGLCSVGTLFSAMAARTTYREVMLPLLMLPLMIPVLIGAVRATAALLAGEPLPWPALQLLIVVDGVFGVIAFLTFEVVIDE